MLTLAGSFLALWPLFAESRWEWNGIPTEIMGYLFVAVGSIWLVGAVVGRLRGRAATSPQQR